MQDPREEKPLTISDFDINCDECGKQIHPDDNYTKEDVYLFCYCCFNDYYLSPDFLIQEIPYADFCKAAGLKPKNTEALESGLLPSDV